MDFKELNIVYIGSPSFPVGAATTKRRRYMVDYMNSQHISCKVLVTGFSKKNDKNPQQGSYNNCEYFNISNLATLTMISKYYNTGKAKLKEWYNGAKSNILIFTTSMNTIDYKLYKYAVKLGYKVVFDIVETAFWKYEKLSLKTKMRYFLDEYYSKKAYRKSAAFVISERLREEFKTAYPNMPICLLPNSTPICVTEGRNKLNETLQILYAGTYAAKEGVTFLIEGVKQAIDNGCKCKLLLLGKAPQALRDKYGNETYIDFKGFVSDEELYQLQMESDVLAMVRTNSIFANYGFPFKLSEYLATGNIVLSTKVSDVEKYLTNKKDTYLIEPENSKAICDAIMHIASNPEEACAVAQNGLRTANEKFSIEVVGKVFVDFLKTL